MIVQRSCYFHQRGSFYVFFLFLFFIDEHSSVHLLFTTLPTLPTLNHTFALISYYGVVVCNEVAFDVVLLM